MIEDTEPQQTAPQWTFGNFGLVIFASLLGALVASIVVIATGVDPRELRALDLAIILSGQLLGGLGALYHLSSYHGISDWRHDYGLRIFPFRWPAFVFGGGLQIALSLAAALVLPEDAGDQELTTALGADSPLAPRIALAFLVVLVGPVVEELMFRSILLSRLLRSMSALWTVVVSAVLFAAFHLVGGGVSTWVLPPLFIAGAILAWVAIKDGDLRRAVPIHMGFNFIAAMALFIGVA